MANYYSTATLSDAVSLNEFQRLMLEAVGAEFSDGPDDQRTYVYWPENWTDIDDDVIEEALAEQFDYFSGDQEKISAFHERVKDWTGLHDLLRDILQNDANANVSHLAMRGAYTCDKPRIDSHGGFQLLVTRDQWSWSTHESTEVKDGKIVLIEPSITEF